MSVLAINQVTLLSLTQRKDQIELDLSLLQNTKTVLTNQMAELSREYNRRLSSQRVSYYANGQYNKITYSYLMGCGMATADLLWDDPQNIKKLNEVILTTAGGLVVLSNQYANAMKKVLGDNCYANGKGSTFSYNKIPAIIATVVGEPLTEDMVDEVLNGKTLSSSWEGSASKKNAKTLEETGKINENDNSQKFTEKIEALINFFYPIFEAAAANGWTTEYNKEIEHNEDYINDGLLSGTLRLVQVENDGNYAPDTPLSYFTMNNRGGITNRQLSSDREDAAAWYEHQKELIHVKEDYTDAQITEEDAELNAINTEIESVNSLVKDATKEFNWCSNA